MRTGTRVSVMMLALFLAVGMGASATASATTHSPAIQLNAGFLATLSARSYVSTTKYVPETGSFIDSDKRTVVNGPNLVVETIDNETVSDIALLNSAYSAIPESCGTSAKFVEFRDRAIGESQMLETLTMLKLGRLFATDVVSEIGDTFTVSRNGKEIESFVIRNGYVVQRTTYLSALPGRPRRLPNEVTSFSYINHAPKIVLPPRNEVVLSPHVFTNGKTTCSYGSGVSTTRSGS